MCVYYTTTAIPHADVISTLRADCWSTSHNDENGNKTFETKKKEDGGPLCHIKKRETKNESNVKKKKEQIQNKSRT